VQKASEFNNRGQGDFLPPVGLKGYLLEYHGLIKCLMESDKFSVVLSEDQVVDLHHLHREVDPTQVLVALKRSEQDFLL